MSVRLILAPAAAGKSAFATELAREAAAGLEAEVRVCVATWIQGQAWNRRLAEAGGAIGIHVLTFEGLAEALLHDAGVTYREIGDAVQRRLLQSILSRLSLAHYRPVIEKPGFIEVLQGLIRELKAAQITPEAFSQGVAGLGGEARLQELATIYNEYQAMLQRLGLADRVGLTWLAAEKLEDEGHLLARPWPLLIFDGFESFTTAQVRLVQLLSRRVDDLVVMLHGEKEAAGGQRFRRYQETRQQLEEALQVEAQPLANHFASQRPCLRHLSDHLFRPVPPEKLPTDPCLAMLQLPDQPGEVRAALRWLKRQMVDREIRPGEVALLARDIAPYLSHIAQTADEFGLPIRIAGGRPLRANPAVAALMALVRLAAPAEGRDEPWLPRRIVVETWRSPYFDWSPIGIQPADADLLDGAARTGRVVGGLAQWRSALQALRGAEPLAEAIAEEEGVAAMPVGQPLVLLAEKFERFWARIQPPAAASTAAYIRWLESLIGPDPLAEPDVSTGDPANTGPFSLDIVARARQGSKASAEADTAALRSLKEVLRGLLWAESIVPAAEATGAPAGAGLLDYATFLAALDSAIEGAQVRLRDTSRGEAILVADTFQARGLSFRAVALLGLAEGLFPATLTEDPFLRDADRLALREAFALPLNPSTLSSEREFFYDAISRASEFLLLTRPRLAETGAEWVASTFWQNVIDLIDVIPGESGDSPLSPAGAASWPELLESMATHPEEAGLIRWLQTAQPGRLQHLQRASLLLQLRQARRDTPFDGDLRRMAPQFAARYFHRYQWSASRLERYRNCALQFFIADVLGLQPRQEPVEGMDASQLGTIYHHILERVYREPERLPLDDEVALNAHVTAVANPILDDAPEREGFRPTPWWFQTRDEIIANLVRSIQGLAEVAGEFRPIAWEERFGKERPLRLETEDGAFQMGGFIDRVDQDGSGNIRIIDYKLGGGNNINAASVRDGKRLQLPLYALAAEKALALGRAVGGFYWHILNGKMSPLNLAEYPGGIEAAFEAATGHAWSAVTGVREGDFRPVPPAGGCPSYCPAAAFCWHYTPGGWR